MSEQLRQLISVGQSVWLDNIRRSMFASGELRKLIDLGLRGMTSNPTIFEKAIGAGNDYDAQLQTLLGGANDPAALFEALAIEDIRTACDLFRPLYDGSERLDGYVSLEVSPLLAEDEKGTFAAAQRLWRAVDRPNLMVKIPATPKCIPAIRSAIAEGININVTLVFSSETYVAAATAFIEGLEARLAKGASIDTVRSVNSVFVSRIDTMVDKLLEDRIAKGETSLSPLLGKAGIANCSAVYERYQELFEGERFQKLMQRGAAPQRPLWASTGTKNPQYADLLYVESLVARNTVNTMPPSTLDALLDHGRVEADALLARKEQSRNLLKELANANISIFEVMNKLQREGVDSFAKSYGALLDAIQGKCGRLSSGSAARVTFQLGKAQQSIDAAIAKLGKDRFLERLWKKDASLWSKEAAHAKIIENALGWLEFPERVQEAMPEITAFVGEVRGRFKHVVVLGMGGSSLAPDTLRAIFGNVDGYPRLHILDSSDPEQVRATEERLDLETSLFIVASKSGSTIEPDAFYHYFYGRLQKLVGEANAAAHFIAITDPGTELDTEATERKFRKVFRNAPDIGGRYSALSLFGMVPAALAGYDVRAILDRGIGQLHANARTSEASSAPGLRFGAAMGTLAKAGRDKLTIFTHPKVAAFGAWAEQLVAESTGKSGTGIVPIDSEPLGRASSYGEDRSIVYLGEGLSGADEATLRLLDELANANMPVIRLAMSDLADIGEQFALWEIATAVAGSILGIDAFDQPNVQESKDNTKRLLDAFVKRGDGRFDEPTPVLETVETRLIPLSGSRSLKLGSTLASALDAIFSQIKAGDYVAFNCYVEMTEEHVRFLNEMRGRVRDAFRVATTLGFGPRFLHSTGQLHKGGSNSGIFLQITTDAPFDLPIPGMVGFRALERAQALGDFESLDSRNRRGARLHFPNLAAGLTALTQAVESCLTARTASAR
jgi:transaldolase/glucose-6-phosphate isomerase